jgi:hypothetical protein
MNALLQSAHLAVGFTSSPAGPRLAWVGRDATDRSFVFNHDAPFSLVALSLAEKDNPHLEVRYAPPEDFTFLCASSVVPLVGRPFEAGEPRHPSGPPQGSAAGVRVPACHDGNETNSSTDRTGLTTRWSSPTVYVDVVYELEPDAPVLRKTIRCTARESAVYIGGVRHWTLRAPSHGIVWPPESEPRQQPVVLMGQRTGLLATLEWSLTQFARENGGFTLEFRPGYLLQPGETQELTAGSLILFDRTQKDSDELADARQAFFAHLARRVRPTVPRPVKFTTWGPWLWQVSDRRVREILPDLQDVGTDLLHIDAGWQDPHFPYSQKLPRVRRADDSEWDRVMTMSDRFPSGLQPLRQLAEAHGMRLSLWFDTCCDVYLREEEDWAVRTADGRAVWDSTWEGRWRRVPKQSLAAEYGARFTEFVLEMQRRYDLHGVVLDNHRYHADFAPGRQSMANGWNAEYVQHRIVLELLDELQRRQPGLYRFFCESWSVPWVLLHATHLHASDPSITKDFARATATDYPLRCLAYERRLAWRRHYDNFIPPWGIKGDIAGWSVQQQSAIPLNPAHADAVPGSGEGWTQNLFTCLATTTNRDIRFAFRQMPAFDRAILKEWLGWDRRRAAFPLQARPLTPLQPEPDAGINVITQVTNGRGILYCFNQSFSRAETRLCLDERAGFRPDDRDIPAFLVYPLRAPLGNGRVSFGQTLTIPLIAKDCAVIEVGLEQPERLAAYPDYQRATETVTRSFEPLFETPLPALLDSMARGTVAVEAGNTPTDRHLAAQILATLGAAVGRRLELSACAAVTAEPTACRLIIGTHDGLASQPEVGCHFRETLYSRYLEWKGRLISAPLVTSLPGMPCPTFALWAPRPEQLSRLGMHLAKALVGGGYETWAAELAKDPPPLIEFDATIPEDRPALRFRPALRRMFNSCPIPETLDVIRLAITATTGEQTLRLWDEEFPPFIGPAWWDERLISLADLAGQRVRIVLTAGHRDGRGSPMLAVGYDRAAVLTLKAALY